MMERNVKVTSGIFMKKTLQINFSSLWWACKLQSLVNAENVV